jgi:hypothetical protein
MSGTEQFILSALILAVSLLGAVLIPIAIQRLPADYLSQAGRPPSTEMVLGRALRTAAGALLIVAGILLIPRWPFRAILTLMAGLAAASFPGKHQVVRRLLGLDVVLDFVNGVRDTANFGPLRAAGDVKQLASNDPELELDIREELAKKLAEVALQPDAPGEANSKRTPIGLRAIVHDPREDAEGSEYSRATGRLELAGVTKSFVEAHDPEPLDDEPEPSPIAEEEEHDDEPADSADATPPRLPAGDRRAVADRPPSISVDPMTLSQASLASPYLRDPGEAAHAFSFNPKATSRSGFHRDQRTSSPPRRSPTQSAETARSETQYSDGDPLFTAYVSVGWHSGARPTRGKSSLWWCSVERASNGKISYDLKNPATRVKALEQLGDLFSDWIARGVSGLATFDFPFGFPRGFGAALGVRVPRWRGNWELIAGRVRDEQIGRKWNNRFEVANSLNKMLPGEGPFWAHPPGREFSELGRKQPETSTLPAQRYCDALSPDNRSIWRMAYGAASGGQVMMGIPYLQHLSTAIELEDTVSVWPFSRDSTTPIVTIQPRIVVAEGYPALVELFDDPTVPADANSVRALAEHLELLDRDGSLAALLGAPDRLPDEIRMEVVTEEGWILGVPAPDGSHWDSE